MWLQKTNQKLKLPVAQAGVILGAAHSPAISSPGIKPGENHKDISDFIYWDGLLEQQDKGKARAQNVFPAIYIVNLQGVCRVGLF